MERVGDAWLLVWTTGATGIGLRKGDCLAVGWKDNRGHQGATLYRIGKGRLVGGWVSNPGDGAVHRETLTFLKALPKEDGR